MLFADALSWNVPDHYWKLTPPSQHISTLTYYCSTKTISDHVLSRTIKKLLLFQNTTLPLFLHDKLASCTVCVCVCVCVCICTTPPHRSLPPWTRGRTRHFKWHSRPTSLRGTAKWKMALSWNIQSTRPFSSAPHHASGQRCCAVQSVYWSRQTLQLFWRQSRQVKGREKAECVNFLVCHFVTVPPSKACMLIWANYAPANRGLSPKQCDKYCQCRYSQENHIQTHTIIHTHTHSWTDTHTHTHTSTALRDGSTYNQPNSF